MTFHPNFWKSLVALCQNGCPNSINAWLLVNSRTPGKIAHITPIPNVYSPSSSSENRPISILPVSSKLFEKVLYYRVYSYLTEHNLINKRQYGFKENYSTELAITTIYNELLRNVDKKLITCFLFPDLSKAFDYCDHEIHLINFVTMALEVFLINYSQNFFIFYISWLYMKKNGSNTCMTFSTPKHKNPFFQGALHKICMIWMFCCADKILLRNWLTMDNY